MKAKLTFPFITAEIFFGVLQKLTYDVKRCGISYTEIWRDLAISKSGCQASNFPYLTRDLCINPSPRYHPRFPSITVVIFLEIKKGTLIYDVKLFWKFYIEKWRGIAVLLLR